MMNKQPRARIEAKVQKISNMIHGMGGINIQLTEEEFEKIWQEITQNLLQVKSVLINENVTFKLENDE